MCSGATLRCLTEKKDLIKGAECKKEIFYFQKMEVSDYRNDVPLANACRVDVDTLCKNVQPGALVKSVRVRVCGVGGVHVRVACAHVRVCVSVSYWFWDSVLRRPSRTCPNAQAVKVV